MPTNHTENGALDPYERAVERAIELELKVASLTDQEWLKNLTEAQAHFARKLSTPYVG